MINYIDDDSNYNELTEEEQAKNLLEEMDNSYSCVGFTKENRNYYLSILNKCLEVTETEYPVDGIKECKIFKTLCHPAKDGDGIYFEIMGKVNNEPRHITGHIFDDPNVYNGEIYVELEVLRFLKNSMTENYTVFTKFYLDSLDASLIMETEYSKNNKRMVKNLGKNDIIKGGKNENKRH